MSKAAAANSELPDLTREYHLFLFRSENLSVVGSLSGNHFCVPRRNGCMNKNVNDSCLRSNK